MSIRGTRIYASSASSYPVTWPTGTLAGDLAIIFIGHAFNPNTPSGWTLNNSFLSVSNWNGATFSKVLTSTDITNGGVTVTTTNSFDGTVGLVVFVGSPTLVEVDASQSSSGATSVTGPTTSGSVVTGDTAIYFATNRGASTDTVNRGTQLQTANDGSAASGCIYSEVVGTTTVFQPIFSYSSGGSGYYNGTIVVRTASPVILGTSPSTLPISGTTTVTVTGTNTHFSSGSSSISVSGSGITVGTVAVVSPTSLTVSLTTAGTAGISDLTVTTGSEVVSLAGALNVGGVHRYWRLNITRSASGVIALSELKFYDASSTQIATTGGTASASSTLDGSHTGTQAFDGDVNTFWNTGFGVGAPGWVQYQFSTTVLPDSFSITARNDSFYAQAPQDFSLQYSDDGVTWAPQRYYYGVGFSSAGQVRTLTSSNAAPSTIGISWRLLITADSSNQSAGISELILKDSSGSVIPTSSYAALVSSTTGADVAGSFAFDGSTSTFWNSSGTPSVGSPQSIGFRFSSSSIYPAKILITARNDGSFGQAPSAFKLQKSTDEVTWTDVQTYTATWAGAGQLQTFNVDSAPPALQPIIFVAT